MRKQHKKYSKPRQIFNKQRIGEENILIKKYGLKNKKEIWKANSEISRIRRKAKNLLRSSQEKQEFFIAKLKQKGFDVNSLDDILGLSIEDLLERRLQTIVFKKRIANTPKQARQLIVHKKISVNNQKINIPSYLVPLELEDKLKLVQKAAKKEKKLVQNLEVSPEEKVREEKKEEKND